MNVDAAWIFVFVHNSLFCVFMTSLTISAATIWRKLIVFFVMPSLKNSNSILLVQKLIIYIAVSLHS